MVRAFFGITQFLLCILQIITFRLYYTIPLYSTNSIYFLLTELVSGTISNIDVDDDDDNDRVNETTMTGYKLHE